MLPNDNAVLRAALTAALAAGLSGCGDKGECVDPTPLSTVYTELGVDFLAYRDTSEAGDTGVGDYENSEYEAYGTACATASDADTCAAALDQAWPSPDDGEWRDCGQVGCSYRGFVTTQGDEVTLADTLGEIVQLMGGIDSEAKALALADGPHETSPECNTVKAKGDAFQMKAKVTTSECPYTRELQLIEIDADGNLEVLEVLDVEESGDCVGRRPEGLQAAGAACGDVLGQHLARVARLEGAAVVAFERLAKDLERFGAPASLVARARAAAIDEVAHARMMNELAATHGAAPLSVEVAPHEERGLFAFALENAVEGCVRETYGVVDAAFRATQATTPELRAVFARIAADEARHAELSWDVARWAESRLAPEEVAQLALARAQAHQQLQDELARDRPAAIVEQLGAPDARQALAMAQQLQQRLEG